MFFGYLISTVFNCLHDTESEYIWLWFMGSYISIVLFDISKNDPFLVPYIVHLENHNSWIKTTDTEVRARLIQNLMK
jgi:hypothetical protein